MINGYLTRQELCDEFNSIKLEKWSLLSLDNIEIKEYKDKIIYVDIFKIGETGSNKDRIKVIFYTENDFYNESKCYEMRFYGIEDYAASVIFNENKLYFRKTILLISCFSNISKDIFSKMQLYFNV